MTTTLLKGGRIIDPAHGTDAVRDLWLRDGRIVAAPTDGAPADVVHDVAGCVVMAGGIDMHTHIGGGKMNLARLLLPEDHRNFPQPAESGLIEELASSGCCTPGTLATGYRYVEMGYTAAFEPAMPFSNARHAHLEMGDVPILDHGAYVMLGNDELFLKLLAEGRDFGHLRDYVGWAMNASKAMGVKVVNPGGISAFKFNQRKLDVDEAHTHWGVTPRRIVQTLARALAELGVPHPLHVHASNLGVPGNIASTLATMDALEGQRAHLTHIQFHAYGTDGPQKFSSAALDIVEGLKRHPNVSIDVGQIMFGQTITTSGDTMRQHANSAFANPKKWVGADIECDAGCGLVPFKYREQSYVNALQWSIGLEIFLLADDPWRLALTTDHPNGGPFTSYPHLIRLLMDKDFRDEQLARLHPDVAAQSALKHIRRELSLSEIAILTRAAPARLLGLADRGQLGEGSAADVTVYRDQVDRQAMFTTPTLVFKDGTLVARDGVLQAVPTGGVHHVAPEYDRGIERVVEAHTERYLGHSLRAVAISDDELCHCANGGRLLRCALHARQAEGAAA